MSARPADIPDWARLLAAAEQPLPTAGPNSHRVLIATNIGGHGPVGVMESMLAAALRVRGSEVHVVLCDTALPACLRAEFSDIPDPSVLVQGRLAEVICPGCVWRGQSVFAGLPIKVHKLSAYLTDEDRASAYRWAQEVPADDLATAEWRGYPVGEQGRAGALRYYARADLAAEPLGEAVMRRYLEAAVLSATAYERIVEAVRPTRAIYHHGLYIPQGLVNTLLRRKGVPLVNWFVAYRKNSFICSHGDTYHHTLMDEPLEGWEAMPWGDRQRSDIQTYLQSRWYGTRDWISFSEKPDLDFAKVAAEMGLDPSKPTIGLLSNVAWDAQLHYPRNAFNSMLDWVMTTIAWFAGRPELQLLIRIHPAEIRGTARSRQPLLEEIQASFPVLPPNVFIIGPEAATSTYAAMEGCDSVIIYGTKTGVELTARGIPVIVAGEAWIRNKGLTIDASDRDQYLQILEGLPLGKRLAPEQVDRARRYAYHFFFRRMIPLKFMHPNGKNTLYDVAIHSTDELRPGQDLGLDIICDGLLEGRPFVFPAETVGVHDL